MGDDFEGDAAKGDFEGEIVEAGEGDFLRLGLDEAIEGIDGDHEGGRDVDVEDVFLFKHAQLAGG